MTSPTQPLQRPATYADLEALPEHIKGEIIDGVLYTQPRPRMRHSRAGLALGRAISGPYDFDADGPGGWWILIEPGIELPNAPEIAPDIAGWRRARLPPPDPDDPIRVAPDWVCEVLSRSNRAYDRKIKFPFYAKVGVSHLWVVDTAAHTVEIKKLIDGRWTEIAVFADDDVLCAEPFEAVQIPLAPIWLPEK
jgi:Uma2 family endonuclease